MIVRALAGAHLEAAAAVSARCFDAPWSADELAREAARPVGRVLVALERDAVLGYAVGHLVVDELEVLTLAVDPAHRRRGVARALVAALVEGAAEAHLEVRADNAGARALYAGAGFREVGRRPGYYADGEDAVLMGWSRPSSPRSR